MIKTMTTVRNLRRALLQMAMVALAACATSPAWSQPKTIRMVIAFPAGGPVDFVGRSISDALGKELGAQIIVENRPGANGIIAAEYVIKAPPDGSVLWFTSVGAVAINPGLYPNLPYDPLQDLAPISLVVRNDELLVVGNTNPATGPTDFVANAKKKRTTMATSGIGSVPHLAAELLASATGADLAAVPYKGSATCARASSSPLRWPQTLGIPCCRRSRRSRRSGSTAWIPTTGMPFSRPKARRLPKSTASTRPFVVCWPTKRSRQGY